MATYGSGIKFDVQVSVSVTAAGVAYTVPAGKYAVLNWVLAANNGVTVSMAIDGQIFAKFTSAATPQFISSANSGDAVIAGGATAPSVGGVIWVAAGSVITYATSGTGRLSLNGPLFKNS